MARPKEWSGLEATLLRRALGMSLRKFATTLGVAEGTVSKWKRLGAAICPNADSQARLDTMLARAGEEAQQHFSRLLTGADLAHAEDPADATHRPSEPGLAFTTTPDALLAACAALWAADLNHDHELLRQDVPGPLVKLAALEWLVAGPPQSWRSTHGSRHVTADDVATVRAMVRRMETLDHRFGGGYARRDALRCLAGEVGAMLRGTFTDPAVGKELCAAAAQLMCRTGAMAYDIGLHGWARRYFIQALSMAHAADDRALGGNVLALTSHQATFLGEFELAVTLARAAKVGANTHATAAVHAMYCVREARALAHLGDRDGCIAALREAERSFAGRRPAQEPDWIGYFDVAELYAEFGHTFAALGQTRDAIGYASRALAESSPAFPRSQTFCRLTLAGAYAAAERAEERDVQVACAIAAEALDMAATLQSARVQVAVQRFDDLLAPYAHMPTVKAFRERARATLANTTNTAHATDAAGASHASAVAPT
ncbi:hypothetical protein [Nonomuraea sp. KM90]|uniref:hypothetical protein n=1 Tax=Nonomuraea sp. KM90 TaxID=3457428 RepID=UPI003FCD0FB8